MADNKAQIVISAVDETKAAMASVSRGLENVENKFSTLNSALARFAPLLGAASVTAFAKHMIDSADAMNDLAKKTGKTVEEIGGFQLLAEQTGTTIDSVAMAMKNASKYMVQHGDNLEAIGIHAKTADEVMYQLADVISSMDAEDPRRVALAVEVLGKNAMDMLPALSEGGAAMREMVERGKELNPVTTEMAENADRLNDQLAELKLESSKTGFAIAEIMLPSLNQVVEKMGEATRQGGLLKGILVGAGEAIYQTLFGPDTIISEAISPEQHARNIAAREARLKLHVDKVGDILAKGGEKEKTIRAKTVDDLLKEDERWARDAEKIMDDLFQEQIAKLQKQQDLINEIFDAEAKRQLSAADYEKLVLFRQYDERLQAAEGNAELIEAVHYDMNQRLAEIDRQYTESYLENVQARTDAAVQEEVWTSSRSFMDRFNAGRSQASLDFDAATQGAFNFFSDFQPGAMSDIFGNVINVPEDVPRNATITPAQGAAPAIHFNMPNVTNSSRGADLVREAAQILRTNPNALSAMPVRAG